MISKDELKNIALIAGKIGGTFLTFAILNGGITSGRDCLVVMGQTAMLSVLWSINFTGDVEDA